MSGMNILDEEQIAAVKSDYTNTLVVAAPGSGKTTVIVNRVNFLVKELMVPEEKIAVITFTKAAALNMRDRYIKLKGCETKAFYGTFHALYYRILKEFYSDYSIIDESVSVNIIRSILNSYTNTVNMQIILKVLSDIWRVRNKSDDLEFKPCVDIAIFTECCNSYEKYKKDNFLWDFEDLQIVCYNLLSSNSIILKRNREKFDHILIDEFQDSDEVQIKILQMLSIGNSIFAVGDEDQSIYSFRGAVPRYMVDFCNIFDRPKKFYLNTNYRSPEVIVNKSMNLISNNTIRNVKSIRPYNDFLGFMELYSFEDEYSQSKGIVDNIIKRNTDGNSNIEDNIILYRTRRESRSIIDVLVEKGINFSFVDGPYNFYEHFVCRDIISILKVCCNPTLREDFIYSMHILGLSMGHLFKNKLIDYKYKCNSFQIAKELINSPVRLKELVKLERRFLKLKKVRHSSIINFILYKLGYRRFAIKNYFSLGTTEESFKYILENLSYELCKFGTIEDFLNHVKAVSESIERAELQLEGVRLSTIHGVKGMEFKNVYIINCNEGLIPHAKNIRNIEEERRLFYVGITRARSSVSLCCTSKLGCKTYEVSRFINELKL